MAYPVSVTLIWYEVLTADLFNHETVEAASVFTKWTEIMKQSGADELEYTIKSLSDFLDGSGGEWDWDSYTSTSLKNPELNTIRKKALMVELPLDDEGRRTLESLLADARQEGSTANR